MKIVVSSTELLSHLQVISRVISPKSTMPILDNFLFSLKGQKLTLVASDLEVTMTTFLDLEESEGEGTVAVPSRILLETLKKFPDQPINFDFNLDNFGIDITTEKGKYSMVGLNGEDFPKIPELDANKSSNLQMQAEILEMGISKTLFATAEDELRPVMNGILLDMSPENFLFVASDAHKLVRYRRLDVKTDFESSFILPKKPATLLKNILPREVGDIAISFDDKNAIFALPNYQLVCRLTEGAYPSYNAIIPQDSPYKLIIDRLEFHNIIGRVSLFSNQGSNLINLKLSKDNMVISAQDLDFSVSATESIVCQYDGEDMEIGFKSIFLSDILDNLSSSDIVMELSDPSRAGVLLPLENEENEEELMLLMPLVVSV